MRIIFQSDYIERYGYTAEHHNVITEDGYLISVFRIPSEGTPIILQHGLLLASDSWVLQGPEYDLGESFKLCLGPV